MSKIYQILFSIALPLDPTEKTVFKSAPEVLMTSTAATLAASGVIPYLPRWKLVCRFPRTSSLFCYYSTHGEKLFGNHVVQFPHENQLTINLTHTNTHALSRES